MSKINSPPFDRGQTYYGPDQTIDTANLGGVQFEGAERWFEDIDYSQTTTVGAKPARTDHFVKCRLVRNNSGITLLGKRLVQLDATRTKATGYAITEADYVHPTDEYLTSAGVRHGDLFWVVVEGPAVVLTPFAGSDFAGDIAAGTRLHSLTSSAASTTAASTSTAGRVTQFTVVAATTVAQFTSLLNVATNFVGNAMSARTTGQTNTDILVMFRPR